MSYRCLFEGDPIGSLFLFGLNQNSSWVKPLPTVPLQTCSRCLKKINRNIFLSHWIAIHLDSKQQQMNKEFGRINLSDKVVVSDPCYTRGTWCMGTLDNVKPGPYRTSLTYTDQTAGWGTRVAELIVAHETHIVNDRTVSDNWEKTDIHVGVDSGQAGVFCDTIYPQGETGEYDEKGSFYSECCNATLGEGYENQQRWHDLSRELESNKRGDRYKEIALEVLEDMKGYYTQEVYEMRKTALETGVMPPRPEWNQGNTVFDKGFVSSSGFGDGGYECFIQKDEDGKIVAIKIVFISDEDFEDEEEEDFDFDEEE